jgi:hypothetical protein
MHSLYRVAKRATASPIQSQDVEKIMSQRTYRTDNDARIRHHLEEASTHLAMVKQLTPYNHKHLDRIGLFLKKLYIRHGGIEH